MRLLDDFGTNDLAYSPAGRYAVRSPAMMRLLQLAQAPSAAPVAQPAPTRVDSVPQLLQSFAAPAAVDPNVIDPATGVPAGLSYDQDNNRWTDASGNVWTTQQDPNDPGTPATWSNQTEMAASGLYPNDATASWAQRLGIKDFNGFAARANSGNLTQDDIAKIGRLSSVAPQRDANGRVTNAIDFWSNAVAKAQDTANASNKGSFLGINMDPGIADMLTLGSAYLGGGYALADAAPAAAPAAAGGTAATDAAATGAVGSGGANSALANWTSADALASEDALGGAAMNAHAASQGTVLGNAAAGTGQLWQGNTFVGSGEAIPFGAPGDLMPGGAPVNAAPPGGGPSVPGAPPPPPNSSGTPGSPSMFDTIAKTIGPTLGIAAASLVGGKMQADAAKDAATIQADATKAGIAEQQRQFDLTRSDLAPYRVAGTTALTNLGTGVGSDGTNGPLTRKFTLDDFWKDPVVQAGYQSGLDLGTKALRNAAPLTTGLDSGAAMKELTKFGTDYTGNMAAGSQARFVGDQGNQFNKEAALAGIGQTATNTVANAGTNAANNTSAMLTAQGNAGAAARIGGANAWTGALGNISNWWQSQDMLNRLQSMRGGTGTYVGPLGYNPQPE